MQPIYWVRPGCLYIPSFGQASQHSPPRELRYVVRYLSYSDLFGHRAELQGIIEDMRRFKLTDCIELFSKVEAALEYHGDADPVLQERLKRDLLTSELVRRMQHHGCYLYFFKRQILSMMKLILIHNTDRPRRRLTEQDDIRQIATSAVMLNDHLDPYNTLRDWEELTEEQQAVRLVEFFVRALVFHGSGDLHAFPRYYYLFFKLPQVPKLRELPNYIGIDETFREITSLDLPTYFILGFSIVSWFHQSIFDAPSTYRALITPFQFSSMDIPLAQVRRILSHLSDTPRGFRQKFTTHMDDPKHLFWDFLAFRQKPLLKLERYRTFVPISTGFLKQKVTASVYWTLLDALPEAQGNRFTSFFGEIFQHYVERQFELLFPRSNLLPNRLFYEQRYGRSEMKTVDIMVFYPDAAIFIEAKVPRLHYCTIMTGNTDGLDAYLSDVVLKASKQLDRTIRDFRTRQFVLDGVDPDQIRRYYPVVLTLMPVPQETLIWRRIDKHVATGGYFTGHDVMPLQLMDADELERLDPVMRSGTSFLDIIHAHSQPGEREYPLRNYLYALFGSDRKDGNQLLQKETDELRNRIQGLFE